MLFAQKGVHATSLQVIARELGVTKAAIYYHFKTKHEIVAAVLQPAMDDLQQLVRSAETETCLSRRVEALVRGLAREAVKHRDIYSVVLTDVAAREAVAGAQSLMDELSSLLLGEDPPASRRVRVAMFLAGLVGPATDPHLRVLPDEAIHAGILEVGSHLVDPGEDT